MKNKQKHNRTASFLAISLVVFFSAFFVLIDNTLASEVTLANIVNLTNKSRLQQGLKPLLINPILNEVASDKAQDMINNHYFSHTSLTGVDPWYWFNKNNYPYLYAGENLAINYTSAEKEHSAWMNSQTHRKNILNNNYTEIGVATASGIINNKPANITVQVFGTPNKSLIPLTQKSQILGFNISSPANSLNQSEVYYLNATQVNSKLTPHKTSNSFQETFPVITSLKNQSRNLLWLTILFLGILIIRDLVLESITTRVHRPSITNLILLIMLWTILIGI